MAGDRFEVLAVGLGFWDDDLLVVNLKYIKHAANAFRVRTIRSIVEGECWHADEGAAGGRIVIFQQAIGIDTKSAQTQFKFWVTIARRRSLHHPLATHPSVVVYSDVAIIVDAEAQICA